MFTQSPMTNVVILVAIAIGVIVVVDAVILPALEAYAAGCKNGVAFNASKGRCFGHGPS